MNTCFVVATVLLISKYDLVFSDNNDSGESNNDERLTRDIFNMLNGTYFNLSEKLHLLQRKVGAIERFTDPDQCECNATEIDEFKRSVSDKLNGFSKILSGFENEIRKLKNEQDDLSELLGEGDDTDATTTSPVPGVCVPGWISSPEKCYYVSTTSEKTTWSKAIDRCIAKGANLVEIQTDEEALFIRRNLRNRVGYTDFIYTGRKRKDNNNWVFVSNDKIVDTSVRSWSIGEPDGGSQTCGCTWQSNALLMHDCVCTGHNLFYICEIVR